MLLVIEILKFDYVSVDITSVKTSQVIKNTIIFLIIILFKLIFHNSESNQNDLRNKYI